MIYHRQPPDAEFLARTGVRAIPLEHLPEALRGASAIIGAASTPTPIIIGDPSVREPRTVVVDLGVPRNFDPALRDAPGVDLFDMRDLLATRVATPATPTLATVIRETAEDLWERFEAGSFEMWIDAFRRRTEELRRDEVVRGRRFLGPLSPEQEKAVEVLTRRIVDTILRVPTDRLRSLSASPEGALTRRVAVKLLQPDETDP